MTIRKLVSILNYFFGIIVCGMLLHGYFVVIFLLQGEQDNWGHCGVKIGEEVSRSDFPVHSIPPIELPN